MGLISGFLSLAGGIEANRRSKKEAANARKAGRINAKQTREQGESVVGGIFSAVSSSGLSTASATSEALILESLSNAEFDAQMQVFQGKQKGAGLRQQGIKALRKGISDFSREAEKAAASGGGGG